MASMFRRNPATRISSYFREVFSEIALQNPEAQLDVTIAAAAEATGMQGYDIEGLAQRLMEMSEKARAEAKPKGTVRSTEGGFGVSFSKWVGALGTDKLCLWLADYDYNRAASIFRDVDVDDLKAMATLKTEQTWEGLRAQLEAAIVGAGGTLKGQSDASVHEVDMTDNKSIDEMARLFKTMGF